MTYFPFVIISIIILAMIGTEAGPMDVAYYITAHAWMIVAYLTRK